MDLIEIVMLAITFTLMLGMGATVDAEQVRAVTKGPQRFALVCGFCCQYGIMPLAAWMLALGLGLDNQYALSLLLVGSMPGGTTSNFYCYLAGGDVALSLAMTVVSSFAGVGMVPLALFVYGGNIRIEEEQMQVSYLQVFLSMLLVLIPASIGAVVRSLSERVAKFLEIAGSLAGVIFILGAMIYFLIKDLKTFLQQPASVWAAGALLQPIGMVLGCLVGLLLRLEAKSVIAVTLETGAQNSSLAITILTLSLGTGAMLEKMVIIPLIYSFFLIVESSIGVGVIRLFNRQSSSVADRKLAGSGVEQDVVDPCCIGNLSDCSDASTHVESGMGSSSEGVEVDVGSGSVTLEMQHGEANAAVFE